jgi:hypothetical protein
MIAGALEKGFDQAEIMKSRKAPVDQASDLFEQSGAELFHDLARRPFIALPSTNGEGAINVSVESERCRLFVQKLYYERIRKALPAKALDQLIELLHARAIFDGPRYPVFTRVGGDLDRVCHDLGDEEGKVVEVTATGYAVTDRPLEKSNARK